MNSSPLSVPVVGAPSVRLRLSVVCFALSPALRRSPWRTGTIEGRVLDARRGEYLEKARITLEGTKLEVLTDSTGTYRLTNVPAGVARNW